MAELTIELGAFKKLSRKVVEICEMKTLLGLSASGASLVRSGNPGAVATTTAISAAAISVLLLLLLFLLLLLLSTFAGEASGLHSSH